MGTVSADLLRSATRSGDVKCRKIGGVKPSLAKAMGLQYSTARPDDLGDASPLPEACTTWQSGQRYSIPSLAVLISMDVLQATRSDAASDGRKSKANPARRFKSVRRRLQERFRTRPGLRLGSYRDDFRERTALDRRNRHPAPRACRPGIGDTVIQQLLGVGTGDLTELRKLRMPRPEFHQPPKLRGRGVFRYAFPGIELSLEV
jgi:hypothetical protein